MIKIVVIDGGKGESSKSSGTNNDSNGKKSALYKMLNLNQTLQSKLKVALSPASVYAVNQSAALATQTARQFVNYYVSDIGRANGDSNYQAIVNRRIEQVTDAAGVGMSALNGAGAGSVFGPVGALIGATIGAASSGIGLGFKYAGRERAYQHEVFQESTRQSYVLSRSDYSTYVGRKW